MSFSFFLSYSFCHLLCPVLVSLTFILHLFDYNSVSLFSMVLFCGTSTKSNFSGPNSIYCYNSRSSEFQFNHISFLTNILPLGCDNCTNSLIQLLDTHTATFNQTADRFDSLFLTVSSHSDSIERFFASYDPIFSQVIQSLSLTSAVELAVYGNYTLYSVPGQVSVIQCSISDLTVIDWYKNLLEDYGLLVPQVSLHSFLNLL